MIPHNRVTYPEAAADAVHAVMESGQVSCGPHVAELEELWAGEAEAESAAMVSSGIAALRLAIMACTAPGAEVIIPAYACTALICAVTTAGRCVALADIKDDLTLDPDSVGDMLSESTGAIITVHTFGAEADIDGLRGFGLPIIEDMAHGVWTQQADLAITTFGPTKFLSGVGGGIVSGMESLVEPVKTRRHYGDQAPGFLYNDSPTEIEAVAAMNAIESLPFNILKRRQAASFYDSQLGDSSSPYRYTIRVEDAPEAVRAMQEAGIGVEQPVWDYRHTVKMPNGLPIAHRAFDTIISLPFFLDITRDEQRQVVEAIKGEAFE